MPAQVSTAHGMSPGNLSVANEMCKKDCRKMWTENIVWETYVMYIWD